MKQLMQIFTLFLLITQICFAQWEYQNPLPTSYTLNDVTLIDDNNGWAVGDNGTIVKTSSAGTDWSLQESGTMNSLQGVCFVGINIGVAVGDSGTILKTTNGGVTWSIQSSGTLERLNGVAFMDANIGTTVGQNGTILRTTNGGADWMSQTSGTTVWLYDVFFIDNNNGWAVGDNGAANPQSIILKTTNGGTNWTLQHIGVFETSAKSVWFLDALNGIVVGIEYWTGMILKTTNGGINWTKQSITLCNWLNEVCFVDANVGWVVGKHQFDPPTIGIIFKTTDGGITWNQQISGTQQNIQAISFTNSSKGALVGDFGTILFSTNGGNNWSNPPTGCTVNWYGVSFADANNGTVVGDFGKIKHTINGGITWYSQSSGVNHTLRSVSFVNPNVGTVVGESTILRTTNGGTSWTQQNSGTILPLNAVHFIDENIGWVVGGGWNNSIQNFEGVVLKTTDGGLNWLVQLQIADSALNTGKEVLNGVSFIDANNGVVVGGFGPLSGGLAKSTLDYAASVILKTTDGGENWSIYETLRPYLRGVSQVGVNEGIAVGFNHYNMFSIGVILRSYNGWQTWSETEIGSSYSQDAFNDVFFINPNNGWIAGSSGWGNGGYVLYTNDGGTNWAEQISVGSGLNNISLLSDANGWVVGDNGIILHTTNGGNPVPVELNSFSATANGKEVMLNWTTATELNNQGFEVQRKFASNDFVTIGSVKGHGTTTSPNNYTYTDKLFNAGKYFYRLKQIDFGGNYEYSQTVEINWSPFTAYKLEQNYPNPFNPTTALGFGIPERGNVRLSVLNILGEEIKVLINEEKEAGYHSIDFNASDLPSGVYFYQLKAGEFIETKKMILLR